MGHHGFRLLCTFTLLILILPAVSGGPLASVPIPESSFATSDLLLEQMVPDANITSSPSVVINGSSGEFSSIHHDSTGIDDPSHINLTWTHVANTSLDFRIETSEIYPDCNDFIYLYQEMPWPHDQIPEDAVCQIEYRIARNGSFAEEDFWYHMADVYVWLNDSSGNWWEIGRRNIYSDSEYQTLLIDLNYFDILDGWRGMTDYYGPQEDPEDILTIAVGLSPSLDFVSYMSTEPWRTYNGSVTLSVRYMILEAVLGITDFEYGSLEPVWESKWSNPRSIWFEDMALSDDHSSYSLGRISSYEEQIATQILVRWDEFGTPLWGKTWSGDYRCRPRAVATFHGDVFTVANGYREEADTDILLTKWNSSGDRIWHKYIDLGGDDYPVEMTIGSDGAIYIVGDRQWSDNVTGHWDSFLVNLNPLGDIVWCNINEDLGAGRYQIEVDEDGTIYALNLAYSGVSMWNSSGGFIGEVSYFAHDFRLTPNGDICTIRSLTDSFEITRISDNGSIVWNTRVEVPYTGIWYERLTADGLAINDDGDVYVTVAYWRFQDAWILFKFDAAGIQEWNKTILAMNWYNLWSGIPGSTCSHFAANGLLYFGGMYMYEDDRPSSLCIAILNPDDAALPIPPTSVTTTSTSTTTTINGRFDFMLLAIGGGGVIVIMVLAIVLRKKKSASR
ncbi:MAG: hypothetical protein ACFFAY_14145 [Promethearchaeota archaeon]